MLKKIATMVSITILFLCTKTVFAGDIPYSLLNEDNAKLYIGKIIECDNKAKIAKIQSVTKIKGDIDLKTNINVNIEANTVTEGKKTPPNPIFRIVGGKTFEEDDKCLVIDFGKDYDNYIFHISSDNPKTLKIENIDLSGMWGALQTLLNEGKYEEAENIRLEKLKPTTSTALESELSPTHKTDEPTSKVESSTQKEEMNSMYWFYAFATIVVIIVILVILRVLRK